MHAQLSDLGLSFNPFEPSASGAPIGSELWLPPTWQSQIVSSLDNLQTGQGPKVLTIVGEYGSGKSYVLRWLQAVEFPSNRRIRPFYFDNPGLRFYDLADQLLRQIGRKDFAKSLWELAASFLESPMQGSLFPAGYEDYLIGKQSRKVKSGSVYSQLQDGIKKAGVTQDEEIAYKLARLVADTPERPYFEHRDFMTGSSGSLVAEKQEVEYFAAILRTLRLTTSTMAVAFLVDEFEELGLQRQLSRREALDYLVTLKRLINYTQAEDLWLILSMTPQASELAKGYAPDLWERFATPEEHGFSLPELTLEDANALVAHRLSSARPNEVEKHYALFPFADNAVNALSPFVFSNPRRLVKVCFKALSGAVAELLPISAELMKTAQEQMYPITLGGSE